MFINWVNLNSSWLFPLLITIIFSGLNIVIAINNSKVSKSQLKLQNNVFCYQLLERRMQIYNEINEILLMVIRDGTVPSKLLTDFLIKTRDVQFLFGEDVKVKCDNIYRFLSKYHVIDAYVMNNIKSNKSSPNHPQLCDEECELLNKIPQLQRDLQETFKKYISFADYYLSY
nr:hypothetical protein [uncultured Aminipila sp.]